MKPLIIRADASPEIGTGHVIRKEGNDQIALLKCRSAYPALPEEMNVRTIPHLAQMFDVPFGLLDHTLGISVPVAAVALGACIVEKHFTLSRQMPDRIARFHSNRRSLKRWLR